MVTEKSLKLIDGILVSKKGESNIKQEEEEEELEVQDKRRILKVITNQNCSGQKNVSTFRFENRLHASK